MKQDGQELHNGDGGGGGERADQFGQGVVDGDANGIFLRVKIFLVFFLRCQSVNWVQRSNDGI